MTAWTVAYLWVSVPHWIDSSMYNIVYSSNFYPSMSYPSILDRSIHPCILPSRIVPSMDVSTYPSIYPSIVSSMHTIAFRNICNSILPSYPVFCKPDTCCVVLSYLCCFVYRCVYTAYKVLFADVNMCTAYVFCCLVHTDVCIQHFVYVFCFICGCEQYMRTTFVFCCLVSGSIYT